MREENMWEKDAGRGGYSLVKLRQRRAGQYECRGEKQRTGLVCQAFSIMCYDLGDFMRCE